MSQVLIRQNKDDNEMVEIYTNTGEDFILWGVVNCEMLEHLDYNITKWDLINTDFKLTIEVAGEKE